MEKGKTLILISMVMMIFCAGCVKDPQDIPAANVTNNPVFHINGFFGTMPLDIYAGEDMWTVQPLVTQTPSNIVYSTIFSIDGCLDNCTPSLEMSFYRSLPASGNGFNDFTQTFESGPKEFAPSEAEQDSYAILLETHPGLFMSGASSWQDLNVPGISYESQYGNTIGYGEDLHVCFQSLAYTGCQYMQCIYFDPKTLVPCIASIQAKMESERHVSLTVRPEGTAPFQYQWFNGATEPTIVMQMQDSIGELFAGVRVTDALGNRSELSQIIRVEYGSIDPCYFPIELTSTLINNSSPEVFADKAEITYTDDQGQVWTSTGGVQSSNSNLVFSNVEYFDISPMQQDAFKATVSFSVTLYNELTGEARTLSVTDAVIALSHP